METIKHLAEDEVLVMRLHPREADAIYALIMWLDGWQEDRHNVDGHFELLMAYRSATIKKKEN